jgi:TATA-binding protein-associated factor Taf7
MNLKPFVNNHELWTDFLKELDSRIQVCYKKLEQITDPVALYRAQGEVQALVSLQKLRDKVNSK